MGEKISTFTLGFDGDAGDLNTVLAGIKSAVQNTVTSLEATSRKVVLFEGLQEKTKAAADAMLAAKDRAAELAKQLEAVKASGGKAGDDLKASMVSAAAEVKRTTAEFDRQVAALTKLENGLTRAGVDTKNLANEQTRLAAATRAAADAAAVQASKQALGLKTMADVTPEINKLHAAYNTLAASGKLSVNELATAHALLKSKVEELRGSVTTVGTVNKLTTDNMAQAWSFVSAKILGVVGTITTVVATYNRLADSSNAYGDALAKLGTLSITAGTNLDALGGQARKLALTLGVDVVQVLESMYELLRSGTPPDNVIEVLTRAATAGKTAIGGLKASVETADALMDAFGTTLGGLGADLDKVVRISQLGGPTMQDFAQGGAKLFSVMQDTNRTLEEVAPALVVMTKGSNDAAGSMATLAKIMEQLGTEDVRRRLEGMGITTTNLNEIFAQLSQRAGASASDVIGLGVGSAKSAPMIAALTNNVKEMPAVFDEVVRSAGAANDAMNKMADAHKARKEKWDAEVKDLEISFGPGSKFASIGTFIMRTLREIDEELGRLFSGEGPAPQGTYLIDTFTAWVASLVGLKPAADAATASTQALGTATAQTGAQAAQSAKDVAAANAAISKAATDLSSAATSILDNVAKMQAATAASIALAQKVATDEIAALDRRAAAQLDTAEKTLAIHKKLADDTLALLKANESKVTEATEKAIAARTESMRRAGKTEQDIAAETTRIRLGYVKQTLDAYTAEYDRLRGLHDGYVSQVNQTEQGRLAFQQGIEDKLFQIRIGGLSSFDQYIAKAAEADRLVSLSREAAAKGDVKKAEEFGNKAIAIADTMGTAYSSNGAQIISTSESAARKAGVIQQVLDSVNTAYKNQGTAAKQGADETLREMERVLPKVTELRDLWRQINETAATQVKVGIEIDQASLAAAQSTLDALTAPRTVTVTVNEVAGTRVGNNAGGFVRNAWALAKGGMAKAAQAAQGFATGGPVFRRPSWSKVPGAGDSDSVAAGLPSGSYVLRKSASQYYGDGLLSRLARGFAFGGPVGPNPNGPASPWSAGYFNSPEEIQKLHELKVILDTEVQAILDRASGLPAAYLGQDVRNYVRNVQELGRNSNKPEDVQAWIDLLVNYWGRFYPAIENSKRAHVPLVMPMGQAPNDSEPTGNKRDAWADLQKSKSSWERMNPGSGGQFRFNQGGAAPAKQDTVPAWLTPGEWVVRPERVREIGAGFMHALNSMAVSRDSLASLLMPVAPRGYATGGPVGWDTEMAARAGNVTPRQVEEANAANKAMAVNFYLDASDLLSEEQVRRKVVPVLDSITRRGR